ncbi:MAG: amidohydrolase family protein [Verrucomicrobiota bacterium]
MLIQSPVILTMDGENPPLAGAIRVESNRVKEIGPDLEPDSGEEVVVLNRHILMPGMINAHCHLDYTGLHGSIFPGKSFTAWIKQINALKQSLGPEDYLQAIQAGYRMLLKSGCTTVFNLESFPELLLKLPRPPMRVWWFLELIDVRTRLESDEMLMGALDFFERHPEWLGGFGLAPHAPYTASIELFRLARHCSEKLGMPFTTHIAESLDENEMFHSGDGELYDFLASMGRDMSDCGHGSPLSHLMEFGLLNDRCLATHLNYLQDNDLQHLEQQPLTVIHCPLCHDYFGHEKFPLEEIEATGSQVAIGTDSLASNTQDRLDLRAELRCARKNFPRHDAKTWLQKVTTIPAAAIGKADELGVLKPGALADLVAFETPGAEHVPDPYDWIIESTHAPHFTLINGIHL